MADFVADTFSVVADTVELPEFTYLLNIFVKHAKSSSRVLIKPS